MSQNTIERMISSFGSSRLAAIVKSYDQFREEAIYQPSQYDALSEELKKFLRRTDLKNYQKHMVNVLELRKMLIPEELEDSKDRRQNLVNRLSMLLNEAAEVCPSESCSSAEKYFTLHMMIDLFFTYLGSDDKVLVKYLTMLSNLLKKMKEDAGGSFSEFYDDAVPDDFVIYSYDDLHLFLRAKNVTEDAWFQRMSKEFLEGTSSYQLLKDMFNRKSLEDRERKEREEQRRKEEEQRRKREEEQRRKEEEQRRKREEEQRRKAEEEKGFNTQKPSAAEKSGKKKNIVLICLAILAVLCLMVSAFLFFKEGKTEQPQIEVQLSVEEALLQLDEAMANSQDEYDQKRFEEYIKKHSMDTTITTEAATEQMSVEFAESEAEKIAELLMELLNGIEDPDKQQAVKEEVAALLGESVQTDAVDDGTTEEGTAEGEDVREMGALEVAEHLKKLLEEGRISEEDLPKIRAVLTAIYYTEGGSTGADQNAEAILREVTSALASGSTSFVNELIQVFEQFGYEIVLSSAGEPAQN